MRDDLPKLHWKTHESMKKARCGSRDGTMTLRLGLVTCGMCLRLAKKESHNLKLLKEAHQDARPHTKCPAY